MCVCACVLTVMLLYSSSNMSRKISSPYEIEREEDRWGGGWGGVQSMRGCNWRKEYNRGVSFADVRGVL